MYAIQFSKKSTTRYFTSAPKILPKLLSVANYKLSTIVPEYYTIV